METGEEQVKHDSKPEGAVGGNVQLMDPKFTHLKDKSWQPDRERQGDEDVRKLMSMPGGEYYCVSERGGLEAVTERATENHTCFGKRTPSNLHREIRQLEDISLQDKTVYTLQEIKEQREFVLTSAASFATTAKELGKNMCLYCAVDGHHIANCKELAKIKLEDRRSVITGKGLCWGCLEAVHRAATCKNKALYEICKKQHPTVLHDDNQTRKGSGAAPKQAVASIEATEAVENIEVEISFCVGVAEGAIYHGVLPILVRAGRDPGRSVLTYGLYDNGSTSCFVTSEIQEKLGVPGNTTSLSIRTMHGCKISGCLAVDVLIVTDVARRNVVRLT